MLSHFISQNWKQNQKHKHKISQFLNNQEGGGGGRGGGGMARQIGQIEVGGL